jgi:hypothetical protein
VTHSAPIPTTLAELLEVIRIYTVRRYRWFGSAFLIGVAVVGVAWWNWHDIRALPGVAPLQRWMTPEPTARLAAFAVAIASLENDAEAEQQTILVEGMKEVPGIDVLRLSAEIPGGRNDDSLEENGTLDAARRLLRRTGAQVLIWGTVLRSGETRVMKIYCAAVSGPPIFLGRYIQTRDLDATDDLKRKIGNEIARSIVGFKEQLDATRPVIETPLVASFAVRVRRLVDAPELPPFLTGDNKASAVVALTHAELTLAEREATDEPIRHSRSRIERMLRSLSADIDITKLQQLEYFHGVTLAAEALQLPNSSRTQSFLDSIQSVREAHRDSTRDCVAVDWDTDEFSNPPLLSWIDEKFGPAPHIELIEAAYRGALKSSDAGPARVKRYVMLIDLGDVMLEKSLRDSNIRWLEEAARFYREATEDATIRAWPKSRAVAEIRLGGTLMMLADWQGREDLIREAMVHLSAVARGRAGTAGMFQQIALSQLQGELSARKRDSTGSMLRRVGRAPGFPAWE